MRTFTSRYRLLAASVLAGLHAACGSNPNTIDLHPPAGKPGPGPKPSASCSSDPGCADPKPVCDLGRSVCVECRDASTCTKAPKLLCEPSSGTCVECLVRTDCSAPDKACDPYDHRCEPTCTADGPPCDRAKPRCSPTFQVCVECVSHADCASEKPLCRPTDGRCVACLADTDCNVGEACDRPGGSCRRS